MNGSEQERRTWYADLVGFLDGETLSSYATQNGDTWSEIGLLSILSEMKTATRIWCGRVIIHLIINTNSIARN